MKFRLYCIIFVLFFLTTSFIGLVIYKSNQSKKSMLGDHVFSKVIPNMDKLAYISIKNNNKEINLSLNDGYWVVGEANEYYANYKLLNSLFTDMYNSQYSRVIVGDDAVFEDAVTLSFKDSGGKLVDSIVIGRKTDESVYSFVKRDDRVFLVTGKLNLPTDVLSWIQNPSFSFNEKTVSYFLTGSGKKITYKLIPFTFRDFFRFLHFENAYKLKSLEEGYMEKSKEFSISTYSGLVVKFKVFIKENKFFMHMDVSTSNLPTKEIKDYVDNNKVLYDEWYFEIPSDYGDIIYSFVSELEN